jgi:guanosine-3',5'-bis(diphosphate) 3'-pyrophosphohydrolase
MIKIADKIANVADIAASPPAGWGRDRRLEYLHWAQAVVNGCLGTHPLLEERWMNVLKDAQARVRDSTGAESEQTA